MYDPEMRKDCPMRGNLGNCSPVGGFCMDAVSDEICEAVHNAYDHGFCNALKTLKEQEAVKPKLSMSGLWYECPVCNRHLTKNSDNYCARCGRPVLWEGR
jgi:hypothetical protein